MSSQTFTLTGLTCSACQRLTQKRIAALPGVSSVHVDISSGQAHVESEQPLQLADINRTLSGTAYQAVE